MTKDDKIVKQFKNKLNNAIDEWLFRDKETYNLVLEKLFEEWKLDANKKADYSFIDLEKATGKKLSIHH